MAHRAEREDRERSHRGLVADVIPMFPNGTALVLLREDELRGAAERVINRRGAQETRGAQAQETAERGSQGAAPAWSGWLLEDKSRPACAAHHLPPFFARSAMTR